MIVVTGAAGFISSCLITKLNNLDKKNLILVDDFSNHQKNKNLQNKSFIKKIDRTIFLDWFKSNTFNIKQVYHIGARTDTMDSDVAIFDKLNLNYSKRLWEICAKNSIPLIYASSAATYGLGDFGFEDNHKVVSKLNPLNPYAVSKNNFDKWVLRQNNKPPFWTGVKFFNVYGPNEFHKGRMSSVIFHAFNQIKKTGSVRLFKSYNKKYSDGEQLRDFIYVKDVIEILVLMMDMKTESGLFNIGSGKSRSFNDLVIATCKAMDVKCNIRYIDMPINLRDRYQYFTRANIKKIKNTYNIKNICSLEDGVFDYVKNYLLKEKYY